MADLTPAPGVDGIVDRAVVAMVARQQGQLGLVVGVDMDALAGRPGHAIGEQGHEQLDQLRVELDPGVPAQLGQRGFVGNGRR